MRTVDAQTWQEPTPDQRTDNADCNLAEVMSLQAVYWRKQFGNLSAQGEELRALSTKVAASVTEPIKRR
jgi:hypothetical protein